MSEARHRLRILHLSDLHMRSTTGPNPEREPARRYRVLADAWERNLAELLQDGPVDLVCFTGDAADWGLPGEYEAATRFFETLLERLDVGRDRLFLVPGNHDIQRRVRQDVWTAFRERAPEADGLRLAQWMAGFGTAPLGFEEGWRDEILERQAAYRAWVRDGLGRPELDPERSPHGRLGYRSTLDIPSLPFPVHILGFDTSWLCGDDFDANRLRLTDSQILSLSTDGNGKPLPGFRLALLHHPFHELSDGAHCRKLVLDFSEMALRGHLHRTEVQSGDEPRILASGCLFEGGRADYWVNACQLLTLTLDSLGKPAQFDLRFRAFSSEGGHWHDDGSLYEQAGSGRLSWTFARPAPAVAPASLFDPWTPAVPPRFVGREDLLRRLEAAAEEGRSVSVVGDWRIGKSSLLRTWFDKQRESGREVQLLSGEGPEGVSPRTLVETITGRPCGDGADQVADALDRWVSSVSRPSLVPLILIDEFDGMVPRFEHRFLERLRGMLGRIAFVLSSRRELDLLYEDLGRTSPFHNRLELMWLGLIDAEVADSLIAFGTGSLRPGDANILRLWAGRHPFYLQLLGRYLQDAYRNGETEISALDRFRAEAAVRLRELWNALGERDRNGLLEVLSGGAGRRSLRSRGLVTEEGHLFGKTLEDWMKEEL